MLDKKESKVMDVLFSQCSGKDSLLISPIDLMNMADLKTIGEKAVERIVTDLCYDGYFDLVYSDRRGERVFCVTLTDKGKSYGRAVKQQKRNLLYRLILSVFFAVVSFLIGLILKAVFK